MLLLSTVARRLFLDRHAEFWLGELLSPAWSLRERRARVVDIITETPDMKTFVLALPRGKRAAWPGHRAGQYVPIDVELDGRRVRRCYSITSSPSDARHVAISVKRVPGGAVSSWLHDRARVGLVIGLGDPAGEFVLPDPLPPRIALVAGGSGVTPVVAMLRDLRDRNLLSRTDVVVVQAARTSADAAFARELAQLPAAHVRVLAHRDADAGHLTPARLRALIPDLGDRHVMTCGPAPLMDLVEVAAGKPVVRERFVAVVPVARESRKARVRLVLAADGAPAEDGSLALDGEGPLLAQLERAGARPPHGCRMGICNTCRCTLVRGAVHDLATDATISEPASSIRLCTTVARSDELELHR